MTPPGVVIAIHAEAHASGFTSEAVGYCVVRSPVWRDEPVYCCKPDPLANGMNVRRLVDGRAFDGVQLADGSLLGEKGPIRLEDIIYSDTTPAEPAFFCPAFIVGFDGQAGLQGGGSVLGYCYGSQ
jgi:hypothetical protein